MLQIINGGEPCADHGLRAGKSIALLGQGGTGKTYFCNEQAQHLTCRIYACAKTHVAVAGLHIEGATKCTVAALQRRFNPKMNERTAGAAATR